MADMDLNQLAKVIEQSFTKALKAAGGGGISGNSNSSFSSRYAAHTSSNRSKNKEPAEFTKAKKSFAKSIEALSDEVENLTSSVKKTSQGELNKFNKTLKNIVDNLESSYDDHDRSVDLVTHNSVLLAKSIKSLTSSVKRGDMTHEHLEAAGSKLVRSYLRTAESYGQSDKRYRAVVDQMKGSASKLSESFLAAGDLWDGHTNSMRKNLRPADFEKLRHNIGFANSVIRNSFGKLGTKGLELYASDATKLQSDLNAPASAGDASGEKLRDNLLTAAYALKESNLVKFNTKLDGVNTDFAALAKEMSAFHNSLNNASEEMMQHAVRGPGKMASFIEKHVTPKLAELGREGASAAMAMKALKASYAAAEDFREYHKIGIADERGYAGKLAQYGTKEGLKLGMDPTAYAKLIQDPNRATINSMGGANFDKVVSSYLDQMEQFGVAGLKEDPNSLKAMVDTSKMVGVDNKNVAELNTYMKQTTDEFASLRHIIGGTVADFERHNQALVSSTEISDALNSMGKEQGQTYVRALKLERADLNAKTQSIELANKLIQSQEAASRASIDDRFKNSAGLMMAGQMTGMDPAKISRMMQLEQIGATASDKEKAELTKYKMDLGLGMEQYRNKYQGSGLEGGHIEEALVRENTYSQIMGMFNGNNQALMNGGLQVNAANKTGISQSDEQMRVNANRAAGKNDDGTDSKEKQFFDASVKFAGAVDSFKAIIDGPLAQAAIAIGAAAATFAGGKVAKSVITSALSRGAAGAAGTVATDAALGAGATGALGAATSTGGKLAAGGRALTGAAVTAGLTMAGGYAVDAGFGKFGYGKDKNGNDIKVDQQQDDANWDKMNWWQKGVSGAGRGIEKAGSFLFLDNLARQAQADRIQKETAYLANQPQSSTPSVQTPNLTNPAVPTAQPVKPSTSTQQNSVNTQATATAVQPSTTIINPTDEAVLALKNIDKNTLLTTDILWQILSALKARNNQGPSIGRASAYTTGR